MRQDWLPQQWTAAPFSVAEARDRGMPRWRLREPHLVRPTRGVRQAQAPTSVADRAAAFAVALPADTAYSHRTAAQLWALPVPRALEAPAPLDVLRPSDRTRIRRAGTRGRRGLELRTVVRLSGGIRVTDLADTWVDAGELVGAGLTPCDLVVMGDAVATRLMGEPAPGTGLPDRGRGIRELASCLDRRVRPRGKAALVEALSMVRAPVRSPMETRARLMFVGAGFPEPEVNAEVHGADGHWILEGDLVWREQRVVGEYQGVDHASIRRRSYDASRLAVAQDEGWRVLEIYAEDVYAGPRRRTCLRRFASALGLDVAGLRIA